MGNRNKNSRLAYSVICLILIVSLLTAISVSGKAEASDGVSRGDFIKFLVMARRYPLLSSSDHDFSDLPDDHPLKPYIASALAYNLIPPLGDSFHPDIPISRAEALYYAVRSLGLDSESNLMLDYPLPYPDETEIPDYIRGSIALSLALKPSLISPEPGPFDPKRTITLDEARRILSNVSLISSKGVVLNIQREIAQGVYLTIHREGTLPTPPMWIVQAGMFSDRNKALSLEKKLKAGGYSTFVEYLDTLWRVRVGPFPSYYTALTKAATLVLKGFPALALSTIGDWDNVKGPQYWVAITVQHGKASLKPVLAGGEIVNAGVVSSMLKDSALAAVNGGYFAGNGYPIGGLMIDGELINAPLSDRTCFGWNEKGDCVIGKVRWEGRVITSSGEHPISLINRPADGNSLTIFTPHHGMLTSPAPSGGIEIVVKNGKVLAKRPAGRGLIKPETTVIAGAGSAGQWLNRLNEGDTVAISINISGSDNNSAWKQITQMIQAGPMLIKNGGYANINEGFKSGFISKRHPRTAMGIKSNGDIVIIVGDGRNPYHSVGYTLQELSSILAKLDVVEALNLDGGGSSTMVIGERLFNQPSDGKERPVSYGIAVYGLLLK